MRINDKNWPFLSPTVRETDRVIALKRQISLW